MEKYTGAVSQFGKQEFTVDTADRKQFIECVHMIRMHSLKTNDILV